jgi:hypothetical protein
MFKAVAAIVSFGCLVACGATPVAPKAEVTGEVGGATLKQPEVLVGEVTSDRGRIDALFISITETTGACEAAKSNRLGKGTVTIALTLMNDKGDTLKPGTYPIITGRPSGSSGNYATGAIAKFDVACVNAYAGSKGVITSGSVTLDTYGEKVSATGKFELAVGAEKLTGSFAGNSCAGFTQAMLDAADTCQ